MQSAHRKSSVLQGAEQRARSLGMTAAPVLGEIVRPSVDGMVMPRDPPRFGWWLHLQPARGYPTLSTKPAYGGCGQAVTSSS